MGTKGRTWKSSWKGKSYIEIYGRKRAGEISSKISKSLTSNPKNTGMAASWEAELLRRKKVSESPNVGGYRKESGLGKHGWYKGYWCCSSWELAWVIYNLDHNIQFSQCNELFEYHWNNKNHKYKPDFILDNSYIEIKGYMTDQVKAKISQFPKKLIILTEIELQPIFEYVIQKYGKDFIKLYGRSSGRAD